MSSRVLLSIWAFLFGGLVVFGLISAGILEPVSLGHASYRYSIVLSVSVLGRNRRGNLGI